ncbi:DUF3892 domain-containing protein [Phyllobacterium zundukense]|jgi:hypothetical protein|uniref:DUF3892 domain-containing protein n=1 Tax=Phyllobacterium zundukense TaxID=1867719 RepID=A0ACD4D6J2_9HYPH|nr:DUF3892 domain-containing protein [Phyllobacterium zundukense]UXN61551.1 DUF3892 domain-containing protein [Phyllobacterium zundukense]
MADVLVTGINKKDRNSTHEGITHLGNPSANWKWPRAAVIASIENNTNTFFTNVNGNRGDIRVIDGPNGPYVRTIADGKLNDNLLSLPELP